MSKLENSQVAKAGKNEPLDKDATKKKNEAFVEPGADASKKFGTELHDVQAKKGDANKTTANEVAKSFPQASHIKETQIVAPDGTKSSVYSFRDADTNKEQVIGKGKDGNWVEYKKNEKNEFVPVNSKPDSGAQAGHPSGEQASLQAKPADSTSAKPAETVKAGQMNRDAVSGEPAKLNPANVKMQASDAAKNSHSPDAILKSEQQKNVIDSKQYVPAGPEKNASGSSKTTGDAATTPSGRQSGDASRQSSDTNRQSEYKSSSAHNDASLNSSAKDSGLRGAKAESIGGNKFNADPDRSRYPEAKGKIDQDARALDGKSRRDVMEQNGPGKDFTRRDVLDQNSSRGNSSDAKSPLIPIAARPGDVAAGGRTGGGGGGSSSPESGSSNKSIGKPMEGTKSGGGVGGGSSSERGEKFPEKRGDDKDGKGDRKADGDKPFGGRKEDGDKSVSGRKEDGDKSSSGHKNDGTERKDDVSSKKDDAGGRKDNGDKSGSGASGGKGEGFGIPGVFGASDKSGGSIKGDNSSVKGERGDRDGRGDKSDRGDRSERGEKSSKGDREDRTGEKGEKADKSNRRDDKDLGDKIGLRGDKTNSGDKSVQGDKSIKSGRQDDQPANRIDGKLLAQIQNLVQRPERREQFAEMIQKIQTGKVPHGEKEASVKELLSNMKPEHVSGLNSWLNGKNPLDFKMLDIKTQQVISKVFDLMLSLQKDGVKAAAELSDMLADRKRSINKIPMDEQTKTLLQDIRRGPRENDGRAQSPADKSGLGSKEAEGKHFNKLDATLDGKVLNPIVGDLISRMQSKDAQIAAKYKEAEPVKHQPQDRTVISNQRQEQTVVSNIRKDSRLDSGKDASSDFAAKHNDSKNAANRNDGTKDGVVKIDNSKDAVLNNSSTRNGALRNDNSRTAQDQNESGRSNTADGAEPNAANRLVDALQVAAAGAELSRDQQTDTVISAADASSEALEKDKSIEDQVKEQRQKLVSKTLRRTKIKDYPVKPGETLESIALECYDDASAAKSILVYNPDIALRKVDAKRYPVLQVGMLLNLPSRSTFTKYKSKHANLFTDVEFGKQVPSTVDELKALGENVSEADIQMIVGKAKAP